MLFTFLQVLLAKKQGSAEIQFISQGRATSRKHLIQVWNQQSENVCSRLRSWSWNHSAAVRLVCRKWRQHVDAQGTQWRPVLCSRSAGGRHRKSRVNSRLTTTSANSTNIFIFQNCFSTNFTFGNLKNVFKISDRDEADVQYQMSHSLIIKHNDKCTVTPTLNYFFCIKLYSTVYNTKLF